MRKSKLEKLLEIQSQKELEYFALLFAGVPANQAIAKIHAGVDIQVFLDCWRKAGGCPGYLPEQFAKV